MNEHPKWRADMIARSIPKAALKDGAYYSGRCRNAKIARWIAADNVFIYWRKKFTSIFTEPICHWEDDTVFDVFVPLHEISPPALAIPIPGDDDRRLVSVAEYDAWIESLDGANSGEEAGL